MPRTRPPYPEEFRREAIRLALLGDKPQRKLAKDLGISDVLARLRDENATLRMEREILRKAAVFFAREDDGR